jgi:hypothetical protein
MPRFGTAMRSATGEGPPDGTAATQQPPQAFGPARGWDRRSPRSRVDWRMAPRQTQTPCLHGVGRRQDTARHPTVRQPVSKPAVGLPAAGWSSVVEVVWTSTAPSFFGTDVLRHAGNGGWPPARALPDGSSAPAMQAGSGPAAIRPADEVAWTGAKGRPPPAPRFGAAPMEAAPARRPMVRPLAGHRERAFGSGTMSGPAGEVARPVCRRHLTQTACSGTTCAAGVRSVSPDGSRATPETARSLRLPSSSQERPTKTMHWRRRAPTPTDLPCFGKAGRSETATTGVPRRFDHGYDDANALRRGSDDSQCVEVRETGRPRIHPRPPRRPGGSTGGRATREVSPQC